MFKKILLAAAILTISPYASASRDVGLDEGYSDINSSVYLGAGVGVYNAADHSANFNRPTVGELIGGFGVEWGEILYTGLELYGTSTFKRGYTYGIRFLPGIKIIENAMIFGNIGFVRGTLFPDNHDAQLIANGYQYGLGGQIRVLDDISIRGGWNRNVFSNLQVQPKTNQYYLAALYNFTV